MPDMETPEADAVEQQQTVDEASLDDDTTVPTTGSETPLEADEGDLVESSLEVPLDDDDWR